MHSALTQTLAELDELLQAQPFASHQLRPPASPDAIVAACRRLGVEVPATADVFYGWHNGSDRGPDDAWSLYLFPPFWRFLSLDRVEREAPWALQWCREAGVEGMPVALEATGQFLVAISGEADRLLRVSSDDVVPAWPDGTLLGLVQATCNALNGRESEYVAEFADNRMRWRQVRGNQS